MLWRRAGVPESTSEHACTSSSLEMHALSGPLKVIMFELLF